MYLIRFQIYSSSDEDRRHIIQREIACITLPYSTLGDLESWLYLAYGTVFNINVSIITK